MRWRRRRRRGPLAAEGAAAACAAEEHLAKRTWAIVTAKASSVAVALTLAAVRGISAFRAGVARHTRDEGGHKEGDEPRHCGMDAGRWWTMRTPARTVRESSTGDHGRSNRLATLIAAFRDAL